MRALLLVALAASVAFAYDPAPPKILWITGQGEMPLEDVPNGASGLKESCGRAFPGWIFETGRMQDLADPSNKVAIIAGPVRDVTENEAAQLREAIAKGARILFCIDPIADHRGTPLRRLREALRETGVDVGEGTIVDPQNPCVLSDPGTFPPQGNWNLTADWAPQDHPLLDVLPQGTKLMFSNACRVGPASRPRDPFKVTILAASSAVAFARDPAGASGPAGPLAVAVRRSEKGGRLVVAGDATFLTNAFATRSGAGGAPLALAAIAWLAEDIRVPELPSAARPAEPDPWGMIAIVFGAVTGAVLVAGVAIFRSRR